MLSERGRLFYRHARAIACKAWGIMPSEFDRAAMALEFSVGDVLDLVNLEIATAANPEKVAEFVYDGIAQKMQMKAIREASNRRNIEGLSRPGWQLVESVELDESEIEQWLRK